MSKRNTRYILKGRDPVPCDDLLRWGHWFEVENNRRVRHSRFVADAGDEVAVSTVFLALDHNYLSIGEPILFETMVFGGLFDQWQWRYCTWDEAEQGHGIVLRLARSAEIIGNETLDELHARDLASIVIARACGRKLD